MDRLNRMLQAAQGMGMGSAAPGGVSRPLASFTLCIFFTRDHLSKVFSIGFCNSWIRIICGFKFLSTMVADTMLLIGHPEPDR